MNVWSIISILTFIFLALTFFFYTVPSFKHRRIETLWNEVCSFAKINHLVDRWMLEHKSLDAVIAWCDAVEPTDEDEKTIKERSKIIKKYKARAEHLKKWWSIF